MKDGPRTGRMEQLRIRHAGRGEWIFSRSLRRAAKEWGVNRDIMACQKIYKISVIVA